MFTYCIESILFRKSGIICNFSTIRSVGTIFANHSKSRQSLNKSFKSYLKLVNHVCIDDTPQRSFVSNSMNTNAKISQSSILKGPLKRRPPKKKKLLTNETEASQPGFWTVRALSTAEEYQLEALLTGLIQQNLYTPKPINTSGKSLPDVIHAVAKYEVESEPREMYFFRTGTVVMWNTPEPESGNILKFLKNYEEDSYNSSLIQEESEIMSYTYTESGKRSHLKDGDIYLASEGTSLDKYTLSNAISQSVKLGIWEASLDHYIESIEFVTEDLKAGRKIKMSRQKVLRKQGELLALRHLINLRSDLLDTPDFYWERDELESLYQQTCGYFSITKRTRVMNEKINHCVELVELLSSHLSDRHHVRLEWMIIILILVEVCFELVHYLDRYLEKQEIKESTELSTS
ncbi:required for meiotic nuclear division protein 1 homolog [Chelonus insularis]|uniref:required for meiotic nuclear division protein 1 homolog n=1 Tax=Chelonus insularis TaxID=460826 RepID=UPI00158B56F3|nr:required for meiotic nuclear division protein 1 homolog [Chelonus insularis]